MTMKLYEIAEELRQHLEALPDFIDEETGEVSPEFESKLEALNGAAEMKLEGIGIVCRELRGESIILVEEIDRLKNRLYAVKKHRKKLLRYATDMMTSMGLGKHKSPNGLFTTYLHKSPDRIEVEFPDNLPMKYQRIPKVEPILEVLKTDMKNGTITKTLLDKAGVRTIQGEAGIRFK